MDTSSMGHMAAFVIRFSENREEKDESLLRAQTTGLGLSMNMFTMSTGKRAITGERRTAVFSVLMDLFT